MGLGEPNNRGLEEVRGRIGLGIAGALALGVVAGWVLHLGVESSLTAVDPQTVYQAFLELGQRRSLVFVFAGYGAATLALTVLPLNIERLSRIEKRLLALVAGSVMVWFADVVWGARPVVEGGLTSATVFPTLLFGSGAVLSVSLGVVLFSAGLSPRHVRIRRLPALAFVGFLGAFLLAIGFWAILGLPYLAVQDGAVAGTADRALIATAVVFGLPSVGLGVLVLRFGFATPPLPTPRGVGFP